MSYCVLSGQNVVDNNKRLQAYSYMYATSESEMLVSEPRMRTLYTAPPGYMIDEVECSAPERIVVVSGEYATPWRQLRFYVHFPSYQGLGWCRIWGDQFGDDHDALGYELQYTWRVKIKPIYPRAVGRLRPWRGFRH
ncbi:MAG: hypothetical protein MK101_00045 [Phycisphaerales bacterium]|nr:hypothetical protein [Phycisphaerales bacterium]